MRECFRMVSAIPAFWSRLWSVVHVPHRGRPSCPRARLRSSMLLPSVQSGWSWYTLRPERSALVWYAGIFTARSFLLDGLVAVASRVFLRTMSQRQGQWPGLDGSASREQACDPAAGPVVLLRSAA